MTVKQHLCKTETVGHYTLNYLVKQLTMDGIKGI